MKHLFATVLALSSAATTCVFAQSPQPIASADVMSSISMFSYREGPKSDLFLRGTPLAPMAEGEVQVEYQDGNAEIVAKVDALPEPASLGPYTSYVLWALTPDGRAANQGVLLEFGGGGGELATSYSSSQFALIVTAEPHFAVTAPSTMVVLYNVADDVEGAETKITTVAEQADYSGLSATPIDENETPPWLVQARYAVTIAAAAGAERFAPEAYEIAVEKLAAAEEGAEGRRKAREEAQELAREAVVASEDARRAALSAAAADAAEAESAAAASAAVEAERRRGEALAAEATREELIRRLDTALPTRETDRGIVSEIGGVQFASGTADLASAARESLARFAGIVASYPGLVFTVEGHTDNTGSPATNQTLSLERAIEVRDYLIAQGVAASHIDVAGLGPTRPVADNASEEGRARNRRVEIIISPELALSAR